MKHKKDAKYKKKKLLKTAFDGYEDLDLGLNPQHDYNRQNNRKIIETALSDDEK